MVVPVPVAQQWLVPFWIPICAFWDQKVYGGPKPDQILIFEPEKVCTGPLCNYRWPNWCWSIRTNYQTMNGTLLHRKMWLLGPKRPFRSPKTDQILIFGSKKVRTVPYVTTVGQISVNLSFLSNKINGTLLDHNSAFWDPKKQRFWDEKGIQNSHFTYLFYILAISCWPTVEHLWKSNLWTYLRYQLWPNFLWNLQFWKSTTTG